MRSAFAALVSVFVLPAIPVAHAGLTTGGCLAQKQKAWAGLRKCQAGEKAKELQGKTADVAKCQTKFDDKLGKISAKAGAASVACRYGDNGDGTVIDYDTGLQWEKKTSGGSAHHDVNTLRDWYSAMSEIVSADDEWSNSMLPEVPGLAGQNDWRLPSIDELISIWDPSNCAAGPCIDPIFGPTNDDYWSATTYADDSSAAWVMFFGSQQFMVLHEFKTGNNRVRAVRSAF